MYDDLTTMDVSVACAAAAYLFKFRDELHLDQMVAIKLDTLHADLLAEQEERWPLTMNFHLCSLSCGQIGP